MCGGGGDKAKPTQGEKDIAAIAAKKWNRYQKHGVSAENRFIDKVQMRDKDYEQASGYANVDTQAAFGGQPQVAPGQQRGGNLAVDIAEQGLNKGKSLGRNIVVSGNQTDDRHMQGKMSIVQAGMGKGAMAQRGLTDIATTNLNNTLNDAHNSYVNRQSNINTAFGAAGMAARGMQGNGKTAPKQDYFDSPMNPEINRTA